jgi:hypothetical protein
MDIGDKTNMETGSGGALVEAASIVVGLLVDWDVAASARELVDLAAKISPSVKFKLIMLEQAIGGEPAGNRRKSRQLFDRIRRLEQKYFAFRSLQTAGQPEKSAFDFRIGAGRSANGEIIVATESLEALRGLSLDLLVQYCPVKLDKRFFTLAHDGVFALSRGAAGIDGKNAGFTEIVNGEALTKVAIVRLSSDGERQDTLICGAIATKFPSIRNEVAIYKACNHYLCLALNEAGQKIRACPAPARGHDDALGAPSPANVMKYLFRLARFFSYSKIGHRWTLFSSQWQVAFARKPWEAFSGRVTRRDVIHIENTPNHFLADPFVTSREGRNVCFVEDYDFASQKGHIAAYELLNDRAMRVGDAIVEPFHMSFPYVFCFGDRLFMCPETSEARQIRLYECVKFPLEWRLSRTVIEDVSAVDTMIFAKNGRWWMLTNIDTTNSGDHCSELHLFHADSPLSDHWIAHPKNPVCLDASYARNGGLLSVGSTLWRVGQRQGFGRYGKAFTVREITEISETQYCEEESMSSDDIFRDAVDATHHLHSNQEFTVFDVRWRTIFGRSATPR